MIGRRRPSARVHKYGARSVWVDGIRFDSKREANRYGELKLLKAAGDVRLILRQVSFQISPGIPDSEGRVAAPGERYVADFVIHWANGELTVEDVKGMRTKEYLRKKRRAEAIYGIEVVEI